MSKNLTKYNEPPLEDGDPINENYAREIALANRVQLDFNMIVQNVFVELGGTAGMVNWVQKSTANERVFYRDLMSKLIKKDDKVTVEENKTVNLIHQLDLSKLTDEELAQLQKMNAKLLLEEESAPNVIEGQIIND